LSAAAGLVYGIPYVAEQTGYAWESGRSRAATEALAKLDKAGVVNRASELFRLATVAVSPAVVNIQTQKFRKDREGPGGFPIGGPRFGRGPAESMGVGSGVIVDKDNGYIVTNNHVIAEADQILVRLSQGAEVEARLVGADPKTDLAVIQIKGGLSVAAEWGDSDKLAIGDWVLAIGSPYMLDHTVTAGIVSATGRNNLTLAGMDENGYQDFIQTDAAINPGNSGGPLIDLAGKVIGINTAILTAGSLLRGDDPSSSSGGFEGIGLAIPAAMAKRVADDLIAKGRVERGFLGVVVQPLDAALAKSFKVPDQRGALVASIQPGGPADKAGLKVGDVILKLGDKEIGDATALRNRAAELTPDSDVAVEFLREGKRESVSVKVAQLDAGSAPAITSFGFRVRELPAGTGGDPLGMIVIDQVARGSPAAVAGLRPGLRILAVGDTEVRTKEQFDKASAAFNLAEGLPLRV
ncbi:MAG: trypsin-like peptidase domain-containing protein, partial [Thermoleophilia bacterium]|nr:trypsin-like peptidase domain-containing protein [Thermoleophilia bacterium]